MARVMSFDKFGTALCANLGRTLSGRDARLDKLRPNAPHRVREPPVEGRVSAAAEHDFAEEISELAARREKYSISPLAEL